MNEQWTMKPSLNHTPSAAYKMFDLDLILGKKDYSKRTNIGLGPQGIEGILVKREVGFKGFRCNLFSVYYECTKLKDLLQS